jgi:hypothetical protein
MKQKFLLCPQCGVHRFFLRIDENENVYFHIDYDQNPLPTKELGSDLKGYNFEEFLCCSCSWKGSAKGLVKYII